MKTIYSLLAIVLVGVCINPLYAELEPNNTPSQANIVTLNLNVNGTLDTASDASDYFRLDLSQSATLATTFTKDTGLLFNASIYAANDTVNAITDYWAAQDSTTAYNETALSAGTYFVHLHAMGGSGSYTMLLSLQLPFYPADTEPNDSPSIALPLTTSATGVLGYWKGYNVRDINDWYSINNTTDDTITMQISKSLGFWMGSCLFDSAMQKVACDSASPADNYFQYSTPLAAGQYKLVMSLPGAGFGSYNVVLHFDYPQVSGINSLEESKWNLYPNPTTGSLCIPSNLQTVSVYNLQGELVQQSSSLNAGTNLNVSELPAGVYVLKAISGQRISQCRFVKQ
ncbi:MAG: T9SS type A sorting domain-containing protein [Chitinophagales bacterium]